MGTPNVVNAAAFYLELTMYEQISHANLSHQ